MGTAASRLRFHRKKCEAQVQDETQQEEATSPKDATATEKPPFPANNIQNENLTDLELALKMKIPLPASTPNQSNLEHAPMSIDNAAPLADKSESRSPLSKQSILDTKLPPLNCILKHSDSWPDMHDDEGRADDEFQAQLEADLEQSLHLNQSLLNSSPADEV
jgi:hypothetical protein